jgi:5'-deoxynucleotidase YfbR-like HD superfamily hydrolase
MNSTNFIQTYSGKRFNYLFPESNTYDFEEIAHCLSKEQRFANHLILPWSVGQHALLVHKIVQLDFQYMKESAKKDYLPSQQKDILKWAIHHDDLEAYFKDIPTPLKGLLNDYKNLYELHEQYYVENVIKIGIFTPNSVIFKNADRYAMYIEDILFGSTPKDGPWHRWTVEKIRTIDDKQFDGNIMRYVQKLMLMDEKQVKNQLLEWYKWYE